MSFRWNVEAVRAGVRLENLKNGARVGATTAGLWQVKINWTPLPPASRSPMEFIPSKGMKQYTAPDEPVEPADPSREAPRPSNRSQKQSQRSLYTTTSSIEKFFVLQY